MGVVLNPIAYRIGYKFSWFDAWFSHRSTYSMFIHNIFRTKLLLNFIFYRYFFSRLVFWLYSHSNFYILNNKIYIAIYLYDSNTNLSFFRRTLKGLRYIKWNEIKIISEWLKFQLLDRRTLVKKFYNITRILRFNFDLLSFASIGPLLLWNKTYKKLKWLKRKKEGYGRLKKKYKLKYLKRVYKFFKKENKIKIIKRFKKKKRLVKATWFAREELRPFKKAFKKMETRLNTFSLKHWVYHYNMHYSNKNSFKRFFKRFWSKKTIHQTEIAKSNIKLFTIFSSFLFRLIFKFNRQYPLRNFQYKFVKKLLKFYIFFFIKKRLLKIYKNFFEMTASIIGSFINLKIFVITNKTITANFITKYIANGLKYRVRYNHLVGPIRRTLNKLLYPKRRMKESDYMYNSFFDRYTEWLKTFKYERFIYFNTIRKKRMLIEKKLKSYSYKFKLGAFYMYGNKVLKSNFTYMIGFCFQNEILFQYNINYNIINLDKFFNIFKLTLNKKKFKNFYLFKCANHYKSILYNYRKHFLYLKIKYFDTYINYINELLINRLNIKSFKKIDKFLITILIKNLNYKKINLDLLQFERKQLKTYIKTFYIFININLNFFINWFFYIAHKNAFEMLYFTNIEYHLVYKFYENILNFIKLDYYKKKFFYLFLSAKKHYKKELKKSLKIIKFYRNQIITKKYISQKSKNIYDYNIKLHHTIQNWFNEKKMWINKLNKMLNKIKYREYNTHNHNIKNFFENKIFQINSLNINKLKNESNLIFFFFFNFFYFLIIKHLIFFPIPFLKKDKKMMNIYNYFFNSLFDFDIVLGNNYLYNTNLKLYTQDAKYRKEKFYIKKNYFIIKNYSKKFFFFIKNYKKYLLYLKHKTNLDIYGYLYNKQLVNSPLVTKKQRINFFLKHNILYGYKFHFVGRFTRKQKAANLWYNRGYLEASSMISRIDYSITSVILRFSVCSIKVWLYKSKKYPTYKYNVFL